MNFFNRRTLLGLLAGVSLMGPVAALAQTPEEFYKGKTVTLVISAATGGASDFFARIFAPYFAKHIPGQPQVIIENLPGASGMTAAVALQETAAKDGTVVSLLQRNNFYLPLLQPELPLKPQELNWIGSLNKEHYTLIVWNTAAAQDNEQLKATSIKIGATSFANENRTLPAMMVDYFGYPLEIVAGYEGNETVGLAMERGEVAGRMQTLNSLMSGSEAQWLAEGKIKALVQVAMESNPALEGVPLLRDQTTDPKVLAVHDFLLNPMAAGRPFATAPGVPEDRVAALRSAFDAAAADPDFLAEVKAANSSVEAITGDEVEAIIDSLYATPEDILVELKKLLIAQ